jgi:hypothetical protein
MANSILERKNNLISNKNACLIVVTDKKLLDVENIKKNILIGC